MGTTLEVLIDSIDEDGAHGRSYADAPEIDGTVHLTEAEGLSPGDLVWTTLLLAAPLYLLYELSVVLAVIVYRRRRKREAQRAAEEDAEAKANERESQRLATEPWEGDVSSSASRGS